MAISTDTKVTAAQLGSAAHLVGQRLTDLGVTEVDVISARQTYDPEQPIEVAVQALPGQVGRVAALLDLPAPTTFEDYQHAHRALLVGLPFLVRVEVYGRVAVTL